MRDNERVMFTGIPAIMKGFENFRNGVPYYSVWSGKDMRFQYPGGDVDEGERILENLLSDIEDSGDTRAITIKFHPKLEKDCNYVTTKTANVGSITVRVCPLVNEDGETLSGVVTHELPRQAYRMLGAMETAMPKLIEIQESISARLTALEAAVQDEPKEPDTFDRIAGILEKPGVSELLGKLLEALPLKNLFAPQPNLMVSGAPASIAQNSDKIPGVDHIAQNSDVGHGEQKVNVRSDIAENSDAPADEDLFTAEENEVIDTALNRLGVHCDVVEVLPLLADYADTDPVTFKLLIANLKK